MDGYDARMNTFIILLRGINVSGLRQIRMADLQASLARAGFTAIHTYLQSGNVVLDADYAPNETGKLAETIAALILSDFCHQVETLVLSSQDYRQLATNNPLNPPIDDEAAKLYHATFLFQNVTANKFASLTLPTQEGEQAMLGKKVVYLHCPHGYGKTSLNNTWFEKKLGVNATTRNWRSVRSILALCGA
jgi:uncharacterized protein (DUF1697 family)